MFFVDEIHRLPRTLEETFYPAMEDHRLPITVGQGAGARVVTLELPPFTLVGATTRTGLLTTPLRDRFGIQARLEPYAVEDLATIVRRSAGILEIELDDEGAIAIAARSRGTPRVANRLLKRVRDFAEVRMQGDRHGGRRHRPRWRCSRSTSVGLDRLDREILRAICVKFEGGPVGLSTLAVAVGEEQDTIEDVYEPYLLQEGLIKRTPRGRAATAAAFAHLGLRPPSVGEAGAVLSRPVRRAMPTIACASAQRAPPLSRLRTLYRSMAHPFICPNCGHRTTEVDRNIGFTRQPKGCYEVRLCVSVRTARRLLPGARRGVLRLRRRGTGDRLRQELVRLHGAGGGRGDRAARRRRFSAWTSQTATIRSRPCSSGGCARSRCRSRSAANATSPRMPKPTCSRPTTTTAGCCSC